MSENDYVKYRGKCKEFCEELCRENPDLKMVRGHYWCPISNKSEQHWWTVDPSGKIIDPTRKQFLSGGAGEYTEFRGIVSCDQCGKDIPEEEAQYASNYVLCSDKCYGRMVGVF